MSSDDNLESALPGMQEQSAGLFSDTSVAPQVQIDLDADGCPLVSGTFALGGERPALTGFATYDEFNRVGPMVKVSEGIGYYVVTDRKLVAEVSASPQVFSNNYNANLRVGGVGATYPMVPLNTDAPNHLRWRRAMAEAFSPKRVRGWRPAVRRRAEALVDGFADAGSCDAVADFANVLPPTTFLDFLGLPHDDLPQFLEWEHAILHLGPDGTHAGMTREDAQGAVQDYFRDVLGRRRLEGSPRRSGEEPPALLDEALTWGYADEELLPFFLGMFVAALDTVTSALGFGLLHFATNPHDRAKIVDDPALIDDAVEELLRLYPITPTPRVVVQDTELGGTRLERRDYLLLGLPGTGRHPADHARATVFDLDRPRLPNTTFGLGTHKCVGAHLARLQLRVAHEVWHARIPAYRVREGARLIESASLTLGLADLPLEWDARSVPARS